MKTVLKTMIWSFLLSGVASLLSCERPADVEPQYKSNHQLIPSSDNGRQAGVFCLTTQVGHSGANCPGCVVYFGKRVHKNCQGHGNVCQLIARVSLDDVGDSWTITTLDTFDLTSEDFFNMPARSLHYSEDAEYAYLNIPPQLVYRDTATLQFTFSGLTFSEEPVYSNE